ncbi:MAG: Tol-Pal system beta propeller repeat protein TolB [Deltaproteobacteria bacterium]|nr:Tol-Pal system beta propeller repeat protein TolB [Deltaproteobacteria bacterium]
MISVAVIVGAGLSIAFAQKGGAEGTTGGAGEATNGPMPTIVPEADTKPLPIAIPALKNVGTATEGSAKGRAFSEVVSNDLAMTGVFDVLDPKSFNPTVLQRDGITQSTIQFKDWVAVGAQALVRGGIAVTGNRVRIAANLFEATTGKLAVEKVYVGDVDDMRHLAHRFADEVYRYFVKERSVFSTRIACVKEFGAKPDITKEVFVMDFDGYGEKRVTWQNTLAMLPAWSPDGSRIAFTLSTKYNWDLWMADLRTGKQRAISEQPGLNTGAAWAKDGSRVALTMSKDGQAEIYTLKPDGTDFRRLTNNWAIDSSPSWSPDSKQIAFVSDRSGAPHIYVMNADGSSQRRLTFKGNYNQTPDWSPKGDRIAFTARDERYRFDIFTVDVKSGDIERLTQDQGNNEEPSYSPDGRLMTFISSRTGARQVWVMSSRGFNQRQISRGKGGYSKPAWSRWFTKK